MPSFAFPSRRSQRGSVMVLVVAVLGLLAVIGTVYIISARTERTSAAATSVDANLDLARSSVMSQVQRVVGDSVIDATGAIGGYAPTGTLGAYAARNFDFPETNAAAGVTSYNPQMRDEAWLAAGLYNTTGADFSRLTPTTFDPLAGTYTMALSAAATYSGTTIGSTTVVGDYFVTGTANEPGSTAADSYIYLLPFSEASGIRYRFGVRIIDTNRMANLNTGAPTNVAGVTDPYGQYISSYPLAADDTPSQRANMFFGAASTPAAFGSFNSPNPYDAAASLSNPSNGSAIKVGRAGTTTTAFSVAAWQNTLLQIERPYDPTGDLGLFDLTDELELRSYGNKGTAYRPRPAAGTANSTAVWPNTLGTTNAGGGTTLGNLRRSSFTTYSFSRELRPYPDPTTPAPPTNWPQVPARVPVSQDLAIATPATGLVNLHNAALNVAAAMRFTSNTAYTGFPAFVDGTSAFSEDEINSFVANYATGRWNGFKVDGTGGMTLPLGPSIVDGTGLCIRTVDSAGNPVHGEYTDPNIIATAGNVYVGYAAQPFINEIAGSLTSSDQATVTFADFAVELYNPYQTPLSLNGFRLTVGGGTPVLLDGNVIPAGQYFVVTWQTSLTAQPPGTGVTGQTSLDPSGTPKVVVLDRVYFDRGMTQQHVTVDQADFTSLTTPDVAVNLSADTPTPYSIGRFDAGTWGWAVNAFSPAAQGSTLGYQNNVGPGTFQGVALYDRFASTPTAAGNSTVQTQGTPFVNVADFNTLMRVTNRILPGGVALLLTDQIKTMNTTAGSVPWSAMQLPLEAQVHFDFMGAPGIYSFSPPHDVSGAPGKHGDIRAVRLLDQLAFTDRVSTTIDVGGGANDINKIRLPGQINVNTASGDVLRAFPAISAFTAPDQVVANIISYRNRPHQPTGTTDPLGSYNNVMGKDYSVAATYPGLGIRSLSELLVPVTDAAPAPVAGTTIPDRDKVWAAIYNLSTVRSDTFAVYGYLEAVKQNPRYTGTFLNDTSWYGTGAAAITDDPRDINIATIPLLRVAKRRWIAIVDRSFSNYPRTSANFAFPRVVAIKDLPQ